MVRVTAEPLDLNAIVAAVADESRGGICCFLGVARRDTLPGGPVAALEYEAHPAMAEAALRDLVAGAEQVAAGVRCAVAHRTGVLQTGEVSVIAVAAAPHRAEAFAACRFLIEELKKRVPVWKRELLATGQGTWVEGTPL